ncbi:MAG: helix-turn-helix domain-containing protein [Planctomycetota bacterium]
MTQVLKAAISESGLTQYKIARDTGVLATAIGRFMRGESSIRLDKADEIAAYLGLRLVRDSSAKPPEPTPENLARPALAKRKTKRKAKRPARRRAD